MKTDSVIWIDLTDLMAWSGHFTGIQRVVFEYAKRFETDNANFFAYDKVGDRFIRLELNQLDLGQDISPDEKKTSEQGMPLRRKIRRTLGKPYYMLGAKQKTALRPLVDAANFYVRSGMSKLDSRNRTHASPYTSYPGVDFKSTDTVVLLGASWNDGVVLDRLITIKQDSHFRLIQHINDLLPIYQPQLFSEELPGKFRPYINKVIHHAEVITVISEATKRDVLAYCEENKVHNVDVKVVRLGEDVAADKPLRPEQVPVNKQFVLAVGTFEVRKNYVLLYQAMKLAQLEGQAFPHIVITGRKGWLTDDLAHILALDPQAHEGITWLENASDNELSWLYENCMFTVFPSLAEGWGLPIVESLHHGKMSLASGVSSMLEIGGGLVDYFLPYDARECLEKVRYYVTDDRYNSVNKKVKQTYEVFTWDESFRIFYDVVTR
jgi:glycosyltransferase involved in cell wall biosynthesis